MNKRHKSIEFLGSALDDLRFFPASTRSEIGHQIDCVQRGLGAYTWKPLGSGNEGIREMKFCDADGTTRIIYVAETADTLYVVRCF